MGISFSFSKTTTVVSPLGSICSLTEQIYGTRHGFLLVECVSNPSRRHWFPRSGFAILPLVFGNRVVLYSSGGKPAAVAGDWCRPRTF